MSSRGLEHGLEERASLLLKVKDGRLGVPGRCKNQYKEYCGKCEREAKRVQMITAQSGWKFLSCAIVRVGHGSSGLQKHDRPGHRSLNPFNSNGLAPG